MISNIPINCDGEQEQTRSGLRLCNEQRASKSISFRKNQQKQGSEKIYWQKKQGWEKQKAITCCNLKCKSISFSVYACFFFFFCADSDLAAEKPLLLLFNSFPPVASAVFLLFAVLIVDFFLVLVLLLFFAASSSPPFADVSFSKTGRSTCSPRFLGPQRMRPRVKNVTAKTKTKLDTMQMLYQKCQRLKESRHLPSFSTSETPAYLSRNMRT